MTIGLECQGRVAVNVLMADDLACLVVGLSEIIVCIWQTITPE